MEPARRPVLRSVIVAASVLLAVSGCSGAPGNDDAAGRVAEQFSSALLAADYEAACGFLASSTRSVLEEEFQLPCAEALDELGLRGGEVLHTQAFGRAAESLMESDVVFLSLATEGWRVTAAGCSAQAHRPYRCDLKGE